MASDDEVDFHAKVQFFTDNNQQLLEIGLTQKKLLMILITMIAVFFIVLVAFTSIETKEIVDLTDKIVKVADFVNGGNLTEIYGGI